MSIAVDQKYIMLLDGVVENFRRTDRDKFSYRCPLCGDSQSNKRTSKGNFFIHNGRYVSHCFRCGESRQVGTFLKEVAPSLWSNYMRDIMAEKFLDSKDSYIKQLKKIEYKNSPLEELMKISEIDHDHQAYQYLVKRKIPEQFLEQLYWAPRFCSWINDKVEPAKFPDSMIVHDHSRIIIPLIAKDKVFHGLQGRTLGKEVPKYLTIITDETYPKIFGLDRISYFKDIIALEGPFDSMFLDNAIATCGGDISSVLASLPKEKTIVCYDCERRHKQTIKKMEKAIDLGYRVTIWPERIIEKDINDLILNGLTSKEIEDIIIQNSYKGMIAKMKLAAWRKI